MLSVFAAIKTEERKFANERCTSIKQQHLCVAYTQSEHWWFSLFFSCFLGISCWETDDVHLCSATTLQRFQEEQNTYLLHWVRCHRQIVQKETYRWGHMPGCGPALRCSGRSAVCSHSLSSKEGKQRHKVQLKHISYSASTNRPIRTNVSHTLSFFSSCRIM